MEVKEFENLLNDVETRVDRLRALYEQWFQGMERLEPSIPRKEVDRRIAMMRKEQPRNTGLRFRFQQLVQRYTTYQTYWMRVGRQIEEGTYAKHMTKAKRAQMMRSAKPAAAKAWEVDVDVDVDLEFGGDEPEPTAAALHEDDLDSAFENAFDGAFGTQAGAGAGTQGASPALPAAPADRAQAVARKASTPFARASSRPPPAVSDPFASKSFAKPDLTPPPAALPKPRIPPPPAFGSSPETASPPIPPAPRVPAFTPPTPPGGRLAQPAAIPRPPQSLPSPVAAPPAPTRAVVRAPAPPPGMKAPPPGKKPSPLAVPAAPRPSLSPMQTANQARAKPPPASAGGPVDDAKVRSVYDAYVAARKSNNERTDNVSIDSFGKNLRDMAPKFRAKFGRDVDFDVVVVDGKVGIKPKPSV